MQGPARLFGHPIHQMLIVFPLGLLVMAVIFDVIHLVTGNASWSSAAFLLIGAGGVSGLVAAPFGFVDWLAIPRATRAKRVGAIHGLGNVFVVLLFLASWWLRLPDPANPNIAALIPSFAGLALGGLTAWLGGELVVRLGVGVEEGANVNAPSLLSGRSGHAG
jgi:uncharacterized membrane protein